MFHVPKVVFDTLKLNILKLNKFECLTNNQADFRVWNFYGLFKSNKKTHPYWTKPLS